MRQVDDILTQFPGPVTLHVTWQRKLGGLVTGAGFVAFFVWLLLSDYARVRGYMAGTSGVIGAWISIAFFGALAIRAALLFLVPGAGRLTLDADGFEIVHIIRRIRQSWRDVSGFRVETGHLPGRIGGPFEQVRYDVHGALSGATAAEVPPIYGLRRGTLVVLLNGWQARALDREGKTGPG
ncbi:hypothetical protein BN1110_04619 [bacterium YEK0313]|nr:hypothetical protein BN1110_04619 [bacterium YEK0313]